MKEFFFNVGEKRQHAYIARIGSDIWVHSAGETWVVSQLPKKVHGVAEDGGDFSGHLVAPMPGKILKINIKQGDLVQANQVLIVMEAMKMEYTLVSPAPGLVSELNCKEGQQVELNERLAFVKVSGDV